MMDIETICNRASLTTDETEAVRQFARNNCDRLSWKADKQVLLSAFRKIKNINAYNEFTSAVKMPKDWDADLYA